ncbi:hypothetical protein [Modestobacter italicus]|uniref:hypothetical protein n=1 Tax=Modestobacter italicus (strain DSM 44449 / CECT 9708 / BC 501) TaxID=2732864 RepID=UPI001C974011|nr:hypothetical protein [Modestobacter italicus]
MTGLRGLVAGIASFVVLLLLAPLLGVIGSVELAVMVGVAVLVGVLVARRARTRGHRTS